MIGGGAVDKETWGDFTDLPCCEFPLAFDEWARPEECNAPGASVVTWSRGEQMVLCEKHANEVYEAETRDTDGDGIIKTIGGDDD